MDINPKQRQSMLESRHWNIFKRHSPKKRDGANKAAQLAPLSLKSASPISPRASKKKRGAGPTSPAASHSRPDQPGTSRGASRWR